MNSKEVIRLIEADGWFKVGQKGSHMQFKPPGKPGRVTIIHPQRDIDINTLKSLQKQAGIVLR